MRTKLPLFVMNGDIFALDTIDLDFVTEYLKYQFSHL